MAAEFYIEELTCFENAEDGSSIRLDMEDAAGQPVSLHLPLECLNRLVTTLPTMARLAAESQRQAPPRKRPTN